MISACFELSDPSWTDDLCTGICYSKGVRCLLIAPQQQPQQQQQLIVSMICQIRKPINYLFNPQSQQKKDCRLCRTWPGLVGGTGGWWYVGWVDGGNKKGILQLPHAYSMNIISWCHKWMSHTHKRVITRIILHNVIVCMPRMSRDRRWKCPTHTRQRPSCPKSA